ncbi:MAG: hypothetical protein KDJ74_18330 [Notoacmeibacter sp.]|nr:hypothetical protein [Notoacmeibacter sp.]
MKIPVGEMRNGESVKISFDEYEDDDGRPIPSGWLGFPAYWNHNGQYLEGARSPHEFDLMTIDGRDASDYLKERILTGMEGEE